MKTRYLIFSQKIQIFITLSFPISCICFLGVVLWEIVKSQRVGEADSLVSVHFTPQKTATEIDIIYFNSSDTSPLLLAYLFVEDENAETKYHIFTHFCIPAYRRIVLNMPRPLKCPSTSFIGWL